MPDTFEKTRVLNALMHAWSHETARQWRAENPACGQCNVTALLLNELYGGDILKTPPITGDHFYNRIGGERVDLTESQFDVRLVYHDLPSNPQDAEQGATAQELQTLRTAFLRIISAGSQITRTSVARAIKIADDVATRIP